MSWMQKVVLKEQDVLLPIKMRMMMMMTMMMMTVAPAFKGYIILAFVPGKLLS